MKKSIINIIFKTNVIFVLLFLFTSTASSAGLVIGKTYKGNDGTQYIITGIHQSYANTYYGEIAYLSNTATSLDIVNEVTIEQKENLPYPPYSLTVHYTIKVSGFSESAIGHYQDEVLRSITFSCSYPLISMLLYNRPNLQYVNFVNQKNIPDQLCLSSTKLNTIKSNGLIETIGNSSFNGCQNLKSIPFFPQLKQIGEAAFYNCPLEGTLEIPNTLNSIGASAFTCGGSKFKPVQFDKIICNSITPPKITGEGFAFLELTHKTTVLYVPMESKELYKTAYEWKEFYKIKGIGEIDASSISLDKNEMNLNIGESASITATITPENTTNKSIEWESSDITVANVNESGLVTALNAGQCDIIAKTTDGSNLEARCHITVVAPVIKVSSISLNPTALEGKEDEQIQITATVLPEDATNKVIRWSSSDESIASVDDKGLISLLKKGTAVITASATDDSGVSAECAVVVSELGGVDNVLADKAIYVKIFNLNGVLVYEGKYSEAKLTPDYYIIVCDGKNVKVKVE